MEKLKLLDYVKKFNPNAPVPAGLMTMGELAKLLQSRDDLEEGMLIIMSLLPVDEEMERENSWLDTGVEVRFNPALNGGVRLCNPPTPVQLVHTPQDMTVDVTKYFNGIPATASKTWAERHLNSGE
jgi:hypothetical protein